VPPPRQEQPGRQPGQPRPPRDSRRDGGPPLWAIVTGAILIAVICAAVVTVIVIKSSPANHVNLSSNANSASPSASQQQRNSAGTSQPSGTAASPSAPQTPSEQAAAQNLASLLTQSASDRSAITGAVSDVSQCGSNLSGDASTFQQAAGSRQRLLSQLAQLPDASALPAQLVQDLTGAWQASQQADTDFAAWANDENTNGCTPNDSGDANYQAASGPDNTATTDKKAFVSQWNPIATQYGLTTYQWNEL
jgi:hypothetical protein